MKILLVEDDAEVVHFVAMGLRERGWIVDWAGDGGEALRLSTASAYDAIIIDRMLPVMDGIAVIEALRRTGNLTPVLILSALAEVDDRVQGLQAGGDDYLTKPFAFVELLARVEALTRRAGGSEAQTRLKVGDLEMDLLARTVRRQGQAIDLQPREFQLLEFFMRRSGQTVTRTMLIESVWNYHFDPQTNVVDVHISRLRQKIDRGFEVPLLHTVRGSGYCMRPPGVAG